MTKGGTGTWDWDVGLGCGTGTWDWDVGLGRGTGTWDSGTWDAGIRGHDKQTTPNICEYNFRWSRKLFYAGELVSSSRWFLASMVRPDIFACLFDCENSGYRIVSTQGVLKHPCLVLAKKE